MDKISQNNSRAREALQAASWRPPIQRIVGPLRSRINQLAHSMGLVEEMRLQAALMRQLQDAADQGASAGQLHKMVDTLEAARPQH